MKGFGFALLETFWQFMVSAELLYGRAKRRVERWWVLRKKDKTTWDDVWRYLDMSRRRRFSDDKHLERLAYFSNKKHDAWKRKIDHKHSVKL